MLQYIGSGSLVWRTLAGNLASYVFDHLARILESLR